MFYVETNGALISYHRIRRKEERKILKKKLNYKINEDEEQELGKFNCFSMTLSQLGPQFSINTFEP
jgi:hypothetical protein